MKLKDQPTSWQCCTEENVGYGPIILSHADIGFCKHLGILKRNDMGNKQEKFTVNRKVWGWN